MTQAMPVMHSFFPTFPITPLDLWNLEAKPTQANQSRLGLYAFMDKNIGDDQGLWCSELYSKKR